MEDVQLSYPAELFDADGHLRDDNTAPLVREFLLAFEVWARRLRGKQVR